MDIWELYDSSIVSDFRPEKASGGYLVRVKRSKYVTRIPDEPNEDIAYLAGVIAGDGGFRLHIRRQVDFPTVRITIVNKERTFLDNVNETFSRVFGYSGKIFKSKATNCSYLFVNNRIIFLYFTRIIGLPFNKARLNFPERFSSEPLAKSFLAGVFDTDGYYGRRDRTFGIMLRGKNERFLEQIRAKAAEYNLVFGKISISTALLNRSRFLRASMKLHIACVPDFFRQIPLRHEKYVGPRRIELRISGV